MGEVFAGRYELVDPIGRGGAGAVWRAWDHRRRRYVAAKVLQQSDAHALLRFVREQALRIDHPHVLAPASWAADDDKVLFTMDLVTGGSLAHVIGDYGPLPPRFVCTLLDQLLSGLAAVHAEGVVHRDIKPANILLEATGTGRPHLRLSDFGISMRKGEPRLTETNYVLGTPGYFAPEQMLGAEPDFPADLFAVGLVALYLLQGQKPDSRALIEHFAAHGTPSAPQGVPEPLWQVLAGLLQPDPGARFRTATGARKALTSAVEMLPAPAGDEEPVEVFDQIGPLPSGFGPDGPQNPAAGPTTSASPTPAAPPNQATSADHAASTDHTAPPGPSESESGDFHLAPPPQPAPPQPAAPLPAAPLPRAPEQPAPHPVAGPAPQAPAPFAPSFPAAPTGAPGSAISPGPASDPAPGSASGPTAPVPPHAAAPHQAAAPPHFPYERTAPVPQAPAATLPYTGHAPQVPGSSGQPARERPPGPPAKVAVPVLVVALICFAVGFWALAQA
ncbi:serine/threonine-protein kinase [Streptomyces ficellus]|uniref:non-specific serine/threonine protein kinase n=1 Tax=Streptomyces ficellus TaxID=1977088 RepID=A0A6I6FS21_9ACTN|nr:serine/threonine-protein kinase [Streptomyces ficellus]QGV79606.1 serine/threonine protein kinase [Streptomyces ficellus]